MEKINLAVLVILSTTLPAYGNITLTSYGGTGEVFINRIQLGDTKSLTFFVKAMATSSIAIMGLHKENTVTNNMYQVLLNKVMNSEMLTLLRIGSATGDKDHCAAVTHTGISTDKFRGYWVSWSNRTLSFGEGSAVGHQVLLSCVIPSPFQVNHLSLRGHAGDVEWNLIIGNILGMYHSNKWILDSLSRYSVDIQNKLHYPDLCINIIQSLPYRGTVVMSPLSLNVSYNIEVTLKTENINCDSHHFTVYHDISRGKCTYRECEMKTMLNSAQNKFTCTYNCGTKYSLKEKKVFVAFESMFIPENAQLCQLTVDDIV